MIKRMVKIVSMIAAGTLLAAVGIYFYTEKRGLAWYADLTVYCSIVVIMIGGLMIGGSTGPRGANDAFNTLMISRTNPQLEEHDRKDRERGGSVGLLTFAAGILSGAIGYGLGKLQ